MRNCARPVIHRIQSSRPVIDCSCVGVAQQNRPTLVVGWGGWAGACAVGAGAGGAGAEARGAWCVVRGLGLGRLAVLVGCGGARRGAGGRAERGVTTAVAVLRPAFCARGTDRRADEIDRVVPTLARTGAARPRGHADRAREREPVSQTGAGRARWCVDS
eukprot:COSAG02_NODE_127_length_34879_cov_12.705060_12_plen_160_part_00